MAQLGFAKAAIDNWGGALNLRGVGRGYRKLMGVGGVSAAIQKRGQS